MVSVCVALWLLCLLLYIIYIFCRPFTKGDAFVGYHEDSAPAVVLQVCAELKNNGADLSDEERQSWEEKVSCLTK